MWRKFIPLAMSTAILNRCFMVSSTFFFSCNREKRVPPKQNSVRMRTWPRVLSVQAPMKLTRLVCLTLIRVAISRLNSFVRLFLPKSCPLFANFSFLTATSFSL